MGFPVLVLARAGARCSARPAALASVLRCRRGGYIRWRIIDRNKCHFLHCETV